MTDTRQEVFVALRSVAPDIDVASLDDDVDVREELDIDSMDYLNFVIALSKRFSIDVPDAEIGELATIGGAVGYLERKRV